MLKAMLLKYSILLDMDDDGNFKMTLTDKQTNKMEIVEAESYTAIIRKAYSYLLQQLRIMKHRYQPPTL